jgi:hypothetical protein
MSELQLLSPLADPRAQLLLSLLLLFLELSVGRALRSGGHLQPSRFAFRFRLLHHHHERLPILQ